MRIIMKLVFLMSLTFALSANAWICQMCPDSRDWPNEANRCGNCGANKSMSIRPSAPTTTYVQPAPYTPQPQPAQTYISPPVTQQPYTSHGYTSTSYDHWTPLKITLAGPVGIPSGYFNNVCGIEAGVLWNKSDKVYGLQACAICNIAEYLGGFQVGGIDLTDRGGIFQVGAINYANYFTGLQIGGILNNIGREMHGVRIGLVNWVERTGDMHGLDIGYINGGEGIMHGVQIGGGNKFEGHFHGLQIGYINYAKELTGVQLGVFNIVDKSPLPFFPLINACF